MVRGAGKLGSQTWPDTWKDGAMVMVAVPPSGGAGVVLGRWAFDPVVVLAIAAAGSAYAAALIRLRRRGVAMPRGAAVSFFGGLGVLVVALVSPVDAYADVSFSVHMAQHLLLTLLAPPLLALGAPVTLALRVAPPRAARGLSAALGSRPGIFLARPVVGWVLLVGVSYAVHLSSLFDAALRSSGVHAFEHALWLGVALIYWWPIVGRDPSPHPVRYPVRLLSLFLLMPAMSFLAVAIYTGGAPMYATYASLPAPWGPGALASQRDAAVMMWLVGNLGLVVAMLIVAGSWKRDDDARQRRLEAREDAAARA
jgi:putative copper resistance protein D